MNAFIFMKGLLFYILSKVSLFQQNNIIILDNLDYNSWVKVIYSSSAVITPECGCTHISAACKIPVNIIYDPSNLPEAIHKEYAPWKSKYNKFVFDEENLNQNLTINI